MNPFDQFNQSGPKGNLPPSNKPGLNLPDYLPGFLDDERPSLAEKIVGKALGTLKGIFFLILVAMAIIAIVVFFPAYFKWISDFSDWVYRMSGRTFY